VRGRYLVACVVVMAACSSRAGTPPTTSPPPSNTSTAEPPPEMSCVGQDRRRYGSTCCEVIGGDPQDRYPGKIYLDCEGPQIGQPCTKKSDCDIACSCDGDGPFDPRSDGRGPPDGTRGVTGVCTGQRAMGVWMCDIDETGTVSHMIVD
jgi:hypothetical protein